MNQVSRRPEGQPSSDNRQPRAGTLPKGTYDAVLTGVKLVRRKEEAGWGIRLSARTKGLDRDVSCWQALSDNPDAPWGMTTTQYRAFWRFAKRMGVSGHVSAVDVPDVLARTLNEDVTVKVSHTPVGQQATFSRGAAATSTKELQGLENFAEMVGPVYPSPIDAAQQAHEQIVGGLSTARLGLAQCAEGCHALHKSEGWLVLGCDTLAEYLAAPEVTISRTDFYRMSEIWGAYVLDGGVEPALLQGAGPSKLEVPLPALAAGVVSAERAVADATSLARKDLRAQYRELMGGEPEPEPRPKKECADCKRLHEAVRSVGSRWREDDMMGVGIALARLEEAVGLREQGGS